MEIKDSLYTLCEKFSKNNLRIVNFSLDYNNDAGDIIKSLLMPKADTAASEPAEIAKNNDAEKELEGRHEGCTPHEYVQEEKGGYVPTEKQRECKPHVVPWQSGYRKDNRSQACRTDLSQYGTTQQGSYGGDQPG